MSKILKSIVGLAIITSTIGLAATPAQAESKAAQCKRFDQTMITFTQQLDSAKFDRSQNPSAFFKRWLSTSEKGLKQLQSKQFSNPKIRGFQQTALNIFVDVHNNVIGGAEAFDKRDRAAFENSYQQVSAASKPVIKLRRQFDAYCGRAK
jgi:hypothetical protein